MKVSRKSFLDWWMKGDQEVTDQGEEVERSLGSDYLKIVSEGPVVDQIKSLIGQVSSVRKLKVLLHKAGFTGAMVRLMMDRSVRHFYVEVMGPNFQIICIQA